MYSVEDYARQWPRREREHMHTLFCGLRLWARWNKFK